MDWTRTGYSYDVTVTCVHQTNVDNTLSTLSGVQLGSISISENYYSDSRVQAKVSTVVREDESDGYIDNARLRIILSIPDRDFVEELVTGYVSDMTRTIEHGYIKRTYTIEGTLWGLLDHKINSNVVVGKGSKLITIFTSLLSKQTKMQYVTDGAQDHVYTTNILYEAGASLSTILFELAESYSRINVDGHGRITLTKYVAPSKQTPSGFLDYHDTRGLMIAPLEYTSTAYEAPGRAVVTATITKDETQQVVVGYYDAPKTDPTSIEVRGWLKGRTDSYTGTSENPSVSELNAIAKKNWENEQDKGVEWGTTTVFADYHAGDVLTLIPNDESNSKVLVKAVRTDLGSMTQELTLKEV